MKFSAATLLAFAAQVIAQTADFDPVYSPSAWQSIPAGKNFEITWDSREKYAGKKITISLIGGDTQNTQVPLATIATGVDNSAEKYVWSVDSSLGDKKVYGLVLKVEDDSGVFQYSNPFKISGGHPKETSKDNAKPTKHHSETKSEDYGHATTSHAIKPTMTNYAVSETDTTMTPVVQTKTIPCNSTAPAAPTHPAGHGAPVPCHGNCTQPGAPTYVKPNPIVPTGYDSGSYGPGVTPTPVGTSGAARVGGISLALLGVAVAAFAL